MQSGPAWLYNGSHTPFLRFISKFERMAAETNRKRCFREVSCFASRKQTSDPKSRSDGVKDSISFVWDVATEQYV